MASGLRTMVLLALVLDVPLLGRLVRALTRRPVADEMVVSGVPVTILRPPGDGPHPAWVFANGADRARRRAPVVRRLTDGLARAGYVVAVPELPGLGEATVTRETLAALVAVTRALSESPRVRGGRVALVGASTGGGLALRAAADPSLAEHISVVAAVAPFADLRKLVCLTTTGGYRDGERWTDHPVTDLHRTAVARSLVSALDDRRDRARLLAGIDGLERSGVDPLTGLRARTGPVGADAERLLDLLANRDPHGFEDVYARLPESVRAFLDDLSPVTAAGHVRARVELAVAPSDVYFPHGEALALARALRHARLTVTGTLDHTVPAASPARLRELAAFRRFVVRALAAAA